MEGASHIFVSQTIYVVIFAETLEELSGILNDLGGSSRRVGLGMNLEKTKVMFNERQRYGMELSTAHPSGFCRITSSLARLSN